MHRVNPVVSLSGAAVRPLDGVEHGGNGESHSEDLRRRGQRDTVAKEAAVSIARASAEAEEALRRAMEDAQAHNEEAVASEGI